MDDTSTAIVARMIDDLTRNIEIARSQSHDLVARLLDMARIELLTRHYGIDEREFEAFCKGLEDKASRPSPPLPLGMPVVSSGRRRKEQPKLRLSRRLHARRSRSSLGK